MNKKELLRLVASLISTYEGTTGELISSTIEFCDETYDWDGERFTEVVDEAD